MKAARTASPVVSGALAALAVLGAAAPARAQWESVGPGKACAASVPRTAGLGNLHSSPVALSWQTVQLFDAPPNAAAVLVIGVAHGAAPVFGGVLGPTPDLLVPFVTDEQGFAAQGFVLGRGVLSAAAGARLWFQWWIADPGVPFGLCASNTLRASFR